MKTLKVSVTIWKRLKLLALEQEVSIGAVIENLLDSNGGK